MLISAQIIGGLLFLFIGGEALVRGAVALAKNFGISKVMIGLTIVALGTSAPELFISAKAALEGHPDITIGNIIGSNISNTLLILGISALITTLDIDKRLINFDQPVLIFVTILLTFFCLADGISKYEGMALVIILLLYIKIALGKSKREPSSLPRHQIEEIEGILPGKLNIWKSLALTLGGTGLLIFGSDILISGAVSLARIMEISEAVISLTLIALGSSAPELATCVVASYKKHTDIAVGNVIGSNLINIMLGLGLTAAFIPLPVNQSFIEYDLWLLLGITVMLGIIAKFAGKINKLTGGLFFLLYIVYVISLFPK